MSKTQDAVERREEARLAALRSRGDIEVAEKTDDGRIRIVRKNVPSSLLEKIDAECAKLNKKAKRLKLTAPDGGEPVEVTVSAVEWKQRDKRLPAEPFHTVAITGPSIPLIKPGYALVGIVECTDKGLIKPNSAPRLITRVDRGPDNDARLNAFRDVSKGIGCAHCDKLRYRKRMIVVEREATNELLAIGTGCADEYVELRESVIDFLATLFEIGETGPRQETTPWMFPLLKVVIAALFSYKKHGYIPKRTWNNQRSTASHVEYLLWPPIKSGLDTNGNLGAWFANSEYGQWEKANKAMEAEAAGLKAEAEKVIEWADKITPQNDYQHNLKAAYQTEVEYQSLDPNDPDGEPIVKKQRIVTLKTINLAVSGVNAYMKEVEAAKAATAAAAQAKLPVSDHIGKAGYKLQPFNAKLDVVNVDVDGRFGPYTLIEATIQEGPHAGAKVVWFASRCPVIAGTNVAKGDTVRFKVAVVKGHKTYKGTKKTQITRCQVGPATSVAPSLPANPATPPLEPLLDPKKITNAQARVVEKCIEHDEWELIFGKGAVAPTTAEINAKDRSEASTEWVGPIMDYYRANGWPDARNRTKQTKKNHANGTTTPAPAVKKVSKTSPDSKVTWTDDPETGTVTAEGTFTKADFPDQFPPESPDPNKFPVDDEFYKELYGEDGLSDPRLGVYGDAPNDDDLEQEMESEPHKAQPITPLPEFDFGFEQE